MKNLGKSQTTGIHWRLQKIQLGHFSNITQLYKSNICNTICLLSYLVFYQFISFTYTFFCPCLLTDFCGSGATSVFWALPTFQATGPWTRVQCSMTSRERSSSSSSLFSATRQSPTSWWRGRTWPGSATSPAPMGGTPGVQSPTWPRQS